MLAAFQPQIRTTPNPRVSFHIYTEPLTHRFGWAGIASTAAAGRAPHAPAARQSQARAQGRKRYGPGRGLSSHQSPTTCPALTALIGPQVMTSAGASAYGSGAGWLAGVGGSGVGEVSPLCREAARRGLCTLSELWPLLLLLSAKKMTRFALTAVRQ